MKEKLQDQAIYDSLTGISELLKDFGEEPSGVNPFGIAAGAFGIASGLLGLIPGAGAIGGAATGAASGAFGVAAATYKPDKPDGKLSALVAEYFDKTSLAMEDTLKNLFGKGNQTNIPGEAQANTLWPYKTEVARFFDGEFYCLAVCRFRSLYVCTNPNRRQIPHQRRPKRFQRHSHKRQRPLRKPPYTHTLNPHH